MDIQLIKIIEKTTPKKSEIKEDLEQPNFPSNTVDIKESINETNPILDINYQEADYMDGSGVVSAGKLYAVCAN
jgi:hypothetical protein